MEAFKPLSGFLRGIPARHWAGSAGGSHPRPGVRVSSELGSSPERRKLFFLRSSIPGPVSRSCARPASGRSWSHHGRGIRARAGVWRPAGGLVARGDGDRTRAAAGCKCTSGPPGTPRALLALARWPLGCRTGCGFVLPSQPSGPFKQPRNCLQVGAMTRL